MCYKGIPTEADLGVYGRCFGGTKVTPPIFSRSLPTIFSFILVPFWLHSLVCPFGPFHLNLPHVTDYDYVKNGIIIFGEFTHSLIYIIIIVYRLLTSCQCPCLNYDLLRRNVNFCLMLSTLYFVFVYHKVSVYHNSRTFSARITKFYTNIQSHLHYTNTFNSNTVTSNFWSEVKAKNRRKYYLRWLWIKFLINGLTQDHETVHLYW